MKKIAKQDRVQARTPAQLEREYNLGKLSAGAGNSKLEIQIQNLTQTLSQFISDTSQRLQQISTDLDGAEAKIQELQNENNVQTWFGEVVPTLLNEPAVTWLTDGTADKHIGDIYLDEISRIIYLFKKNTDEMYEWIACQSGTLG